MLPFTRPTLDAEEFEAIKEVLQSGWLATGPKVAAFEAALADYIGGDVQLRVFNSGTSALEAVLLAYGIGPGDEVIVPAMSFVASANVIVRCGATPKFVDVDLVSRNIDAAAVEAAITPNTKAVIPVHFAGRAVDMDAIYQLAELHNLLVLEDAAQAIGTQYQGRRIGSAGNPVCFSFHPNKNMTTIEGGALVISDPVLLKKIEAIRFHGIERDEQGGMDVTAWGGKMNMPDVGAALGLVQLKKLDGFNLKRRALARRYLQQLPKHDALVLPADVEGHSWHMFCILLDWEKIGLSRNQALEALKQQAIAAGIHYPAMHLFSLYRQYGYKPGDFPNAERIGEQTLTLPLFPGMEGKDVDRVCSAVISLLNGSY
ncbi:DegT/DnrJ/EryC1/StrS aminotransferase family protein [Methylobacter svalbardensis]|uniref:DegT/DnrJ/EryC1/StrS family aminotransferase n=1 Tax=Methylobacter svalbardensis TaxID=3080016 RepID=UPI0030EC6FA2